MTKLIIRLTKNLDQSIEWVMIDDMGHIIDDPKKSSINELVHLLDHYPIYVLVPSVDVVLTQVIFSKVSNKELIKVIPYALEPQLSDEILNLHFAKGKLDTNGFLPVAVVSKTKMDAWKQYLKINFPHNVPQAQFPEVVVLPWEPREWTIYIEESIIFLKMGPQSGFAMESGDFWIIFSLLLNHPDTIRPTKILCLGEIQIPTDIHEAFKKLGITLDKVPAKNIMILASEYIKNPTGIDLLQDHYETNNLGVSQASLYYSASFLFLLCLFVLTAGNILQLFIVSHQERQVHHQIDAFFTKFFPNKSIADDKINQYMQQELQKLQSSHAKNHFLEIMRIISPVMDKTTGVTVLEMNYSDNQLTFELEADDFSSLDSVTQAMSIQKLKVELQDAKKIETKIHAKLSIQETLS